MEKKKFEDMRKALEQKGYEIIKSIGKGAFGQVLLAKNKLSTDQYAVKVINKAQLKKKPFLQKYIDQQIEIMRKLNHLNIVRYQQQFNTPDFIVIVMQYCELGNLLTYQAKLTGKMFTLDDALRVMVQVMKGLKCIHEKNFIHRDIKSENVLLKKGKQGQISYKIADFGFARSIGGSGAKTHCGTQKYMAPQIISNSYYGISVDIWALGVLFYFMLFAQYPFKGHDMKAQISRRCTPYFNVSSTVNKKQRLKQMNSEVQDFFKKIFVVDSKKRLTFSNIIKHPLFAPYQHEFQDNAQFYNNLEKKGQIYKDQLQKDQYGFDQQMEPQDESRTHLLQKKRISSQSKHLQRQLEQINFQIGKYYYLKECAIQLFDNYSAYLNYAQRLATKFYLLKAYLFYAIPLSDSLKRNKMPQGLQQAAIQTQKWGQCTKTPQYKKYVIKLDQEIMKTQLIYEDTYNQIKNVLDQMPIKNFEKGYKLQITEKTFDDLKFAYRSTTSYIFKNIHQNKKIDSHLRNKIKMRLFCCHMINRIFNRKQVLQHFPYFAQWLKNKKYDYPHTFDFVYFKRWIYQQSQQNLQRNIGLLHKTFF